MNIFKKTEVRQALQCRSISLVAMYPLFMQMAGEFTDVAWEDLVHSNKGIVFAAIEGGSDGVKFTDEEVSAVNESYDFVALMDAKGVDGYLACFAMPQIVFTSEDEYCNQDDLPPIRFWVYGEYLDCVFASCLEEYSELVVGAQLQYYKMESDQ